jgi:YidC/Oxa1 family membrane protein insertase
VEKRTFIFVVLSIVVWGGFLALQLTLNPPQPKDVATNPAESKQGLPPDPAAKDKVDNKQADAKAALEQAAAEESATSDRSADDEAASSETTTTPRRRVTLGSLDPASGYLMLVTLDNRGAAIERIEFNSRFHDIDDRSGYLGHLALTDSRQGAQINVVGPGTPAALAKGADGSTGLRVDDIITSVNGVAVPNALEFEQYLEKNTKPEQELKLTVLRGDAATEIPFTAALIRRPLELIRPESNAGADPVGDPTGFAAVGPGSFRLTLEQVGDTDIPADREEIAKLPSLYAANWEVTTDSKAGSVTFTTTLSEKQLEKAGGDTSLKLSKTFRLAQQSNTESAAGYHLDLKIAIENTGDKAETVAYRLEGPNGLPLEGWWYSTKVHPEMWAAAGARDVAAYGPQGHRLIGNPKLVSEAAAKIKEGAPPRIDLLAGALEERKFAYLAVDTQYFAAALLPGNVLKRDDAELSQFEVDSAFAETLNLLQDKKWAKTTNVSFFIDSEAELIAPGQPLESNYVIFAGPKEPAVLEPYQLEPLIEYGWFGWVSRTLRSMLNVLWSITRNYGVAIILLTVIVRLCLLPFSIRQAKSAAVMQQLQPEIVKIKEKYKDDMEKQAVAQRELFAKHGFNPMGGCLLMFAQLPIFIGLYRTLATDIDLREAALIPGIEWASNLAGPDQLFRWKEYVWRDIGDEAHGWLGPYFNVLPLVTVALFMVQQKLFAPPAVTEEQKMQQNVMNFMTIFMGVMFYKVPAGLCIYFITSSLWGICERKLLPKPKPGELPPVKSSDPKPGEKKKESRAANAINGLLGMADAQLKDSKNVPSIRKKQQKKG